MVNETLIAQTGCHGKTLGKVEVTLDEDNVIVDGQVIATLPPGTLGGKEIVRSLTGIFKGNYDLDEVKTEYLREKYGLTR